MKRIVLVTAMLVVLVSGVFGDGGYQELDWLTTIEEALISRPELQKLDSTEDTTTFYSSGVVAGYDCNLIFLFGNTEGLISVIVEFIDTIDEESLRDALESKYVEIDSNWWDWYLYADKDGRKTLTYIEFRTPMGENAFLWYAYPPVYEGIKAAEKEERESGL